MKPDEKIVEEEVKTPEGTKEAVAVEENEPAPKGRRDTFREGFAKRHEGIDMDDEDAYYDAVEGDYKELDDYRTASDNFNNSIKNSPLFSELVIASQGQEDFNPIAYWIENGEGNEDFQAAIQDEQFLEKLAEANKKALEKRAKNKEVEDQYNTNIGPSLENINAKAEELGLNDEQRKEAFNRYYKACFDATIGIFDPEMFATIARGISHDEDVDAARNEGVAEGLNTKVTDELRKMPKSATRAGGNQRTTPDVKPQAKEDNMFGL